jgi:hypothetical protein
MFFLQILWIQNFDKFFSFFEPFFRNYTFKKKTQFFPKFLSHNEQIRPKNNHWIGTIPTIINFFGPKSFEFLSLCARRMTTFDHPFFSHF